MAVTEVKMKLLIDSNNKRVLFAEAGKECVDFLFYILSLPIGTVIRLLNKKDMVGCISNLYESIENLNQAYLQPNQTKGMLLIPKLPVSPGSIPLLSLPYDAPATQKSFYRCSNNSSSYGFSPGRCSYYVTDGPNAQCESCRLIMTSKMHFVGPLLHNSAWKNFYRCSSSSCGNVSHSTSVCCPTCGHEMATTMHYVTPPGCSEAGTVSPSGGIVKGVVTYMVMDNLEVKPMSTISSVTLLNQFNVKDVCALQEKTVTLTMDKALMLLKLSLKSSSVLTNVFLS